VADCVALFSLGQINMVPVDTHVLHIITREYRNPTEDTLQVWKSMPPTVYAHIGNLFRTHFSTYPLSVIPAISGTILSAIFLPKSISVGASGGIFGLMGARLSHVDNNY
jgi:hypothetical protein